MSNYVKRNAHRYNVGPRSWLRNNQVSAEQSVNSVNCLLDKKGAEVDYCPQNRIHSLSVAPRRASVRDHRGNPSAILGLDTMLQRFLPVTGRPLPSLWARRPCYGHDPTQRSVPPINRLSRTLIYNSHQTVLTTPLTCDSVVPKLLAVVLLVHCRYVSIPG